MSAPGTNAQASTQFVEFQLPAGKFTNLIWDRLYTEDVCQLDPFDLVSANASVVLDRVSFPTRPTVALAGGLTSVLVRTDVFLRPEACLTRDCTTSEYIGLTGPDTAGVALSLRYDLALNLIDDTSAEVCMSLGAVVELANGAPVPLNALPDALTDELELPCQPLPLDALTDLLPEGAAITRSGVSARPDGSRLAMRFEIDGPAQDSQQSWADFASGALAPTDPAAEWSIFIGREVLEAATFVALDQQLSCEENPSTEGCNEDFDNDGLLCEDGDSNDPKCEGDPRFIRTDGPDVTWSGGGNFGGGRLQVDVVGYIPGGYSEMPCLNPIGVDPVAIDANLRVETGRPGWLLRRVRIDPDPVDGDVLGCALLQALPIDPLAVAITQLVAAIAADLYDPSRGDLGLPADCNPNDPDCDEFCTQISDDEYECGEVVDTSDPLDFDGPTIGVLTLNRLVGLTEGAVLGGPLDRVVRPSPFSNDLPPNPNIPRQTLSLKNGYIGFGVQGSCSNLHTGYSGSFQASGDGALCTPAQILDDPPARHDNAGMDDTEEDDLPIYAFAWPGGSEPVGREPLGDRKIDIRFPATPGAQVSQQFFDQPYPLKVLMRTSAGLQHYTIPAPDLESPGQGIALLTDAFSQCMGRGWALQAPQGMLDRLWLVDPPPYGIDLNVQFTNPLMEIGKQQATLRALSVALLAPAKVRSLGATPQDVSNLRGMSNERSMSDERRMPGAPGGATGMGAEPAPADPAEVAVVTNRGEAGKRGTRPVAEPEALVFEEVLLTFQGRIDVQLGDGQSTSVPFSKERIAGLQVVRAHSPDSVEVRLTHDLMLDVEIPTYALPKGVKRASAWFRISPEMLELKMPRVGSNDSLSCAKKAFTTCCADPLRSACTIP